MSLKRKKALTYLITTVLSFLFIIPLVDAQTVNPQVTAEVKKNTYNQWKTF